jgi:hypothetical protein
MLGLSIEVDLHARSRLGRHEASRVLAPTTTATCGRDVVADVR